MRHLVLRTASLVTLSALVAFHAFPAYAQPAAASASPEPASESGKPRWSAEDLTSAIRLFAVVEDAWSASDSELLASLVDTTVVKISVTPGTAPTTALTRSAAAFLFHDPFRLVRTKSFQVGRVDVQKKGKAVATAVWSGDWGGRQGDRNRQVVLTAMLRGNRWLLTEVRAND
jgi:hypothetical protein